MPRDLIVPGELSDLGCVRPTKRHTAEPLLVLTACSIKASALAHLAGLCAPSYEGITIRGCKMARACPHCGVRIDYLKYTCGTLGWESGTIDDGDNWNYDDSGTEGTHDYEYSCPECDTRLRVSSDWITECDDEDDSENEPEQLATKDVWGGLL